MRAPDEEATTLVRRKLDAGAGRPAILQILRGRGLAPDDATRLYEHTRAGWLRERLPDELRRSARLHLVIGLCAFAASAGLFTLGAILFWHARQEPVMNRGRLLALPGIVLLLSLGEFAYAFSRFRLARKTREGRPSRRA